MTNQTNYLAINQSSIEQLKNLRMFCEGAKNAAPQECKHAFSILEMSLNEMIQNQLAIIDAHINKENANDK